MNSIISWVGGKKALRDLIYLRMPGHYDRYIEEMCIRDRDVKKRNVSSDSSGLHVSMLLQD